LTISRSDGDAGRGNDSVDGLSVLLYQSSLLNDVVEDNPIWWLIASKRARDAASDGRVTNFAWRLEAPGIARNARWLVASEANRLANVKVGGRERSRSHSDLRLVRAPSNAAVDCASGTRKQGGDSGRDQKDYRNAAADH
jgi:hypothetical protein